MIHRRVILAFSFTVATLAGLGGCADHSATARARWLALKHEQMNACPAWARETLLEWVEAYVGRAGMPEPFHSQEELIGYETTGLDLWHANHFVTYRKETAEYLYRDYTPVRVNYVPGALPVCERIVAEYAGGVASDREKAVAFATRAIPERLPHPGIPPMGPPCDKNRGLDDEGLLGSGSAWCNEQARVFVRLCQVAGIPARLIFLFYAKPPNGHVIAEFYADGRWCMADPSYGCVFPDVDGKLMSAARCHAEGKLQAGEAYFRRYQEMLGWPDEKLVGGRLPSQADEAARGRRVAESAMGTRAELGSHTPQALGEQLWVFGVMNYPLPR